MKLRGISLLLVLHKPLEFVNKKNGFPEILENGLSRTARIGRFDRSVKLYLKGTFFVCGFVVVLLRTVSSLLKTDCSYFALLVVSDIVEQRNKAVAAFFMCFFFSLYVCILRVTLVVNELPSTVSYDRQNNCV